MSNVQTDSNFPAINKEYIKSRDGILKIAEIILSIITFICSIVNFWNGHGWVEFVSMSAFFGTLINFILHILNIYSRYPGPWLIIEFIYYAVFSLFFLIAAIVAAALANQSYGNVGAAAFFAFAATAVFIVDTVFQYRAWKSGQLNPPAANTATTAHY